MTNTQTNTQESRKLKPRSPKGGRSQYSVPLWDNFQTASLPSRRRWGFLVAMPTKIEHEWRVRRVFPDQSWQVLRQQGLFIDLTCCWDFEAFAHQLDNRINKLLGHRNMVEYEPNVVNRLLVEVGLSRDLQQSPYKDSPQGSVTSAVKASLSCFVAMAQESRDQAMRLNGGNNYLVARRWLPVALDSIRMPLVTIPLGLLTTFRGEYGALIWGDPATVEETDVERSPESP